MARSVGDGEMVKSLLTIITLKEIDHHCVMRIAGELDMATAQQLATAVESALRSSSTEMIILDLEELSFLDASGLRTLIHLIHLANAEGRPLHARNLQGEVAMVLHLSGVADLLCVPRIADGDTVVETADSPARRR